VDFGDDLMLGGIGVGLRERLYGGHQSVVHRARWDGRDVVVKFELEPDQWLEARTLAASDAADANSQVVPPLSIDGARVHSAGGRRVVVLPFVGGPPPDTDDPLQVEEMGRSLARLHATLHTLDGSELPDVAMLRAVAGDDEAVVRGDRQLIHGDFGAANLVSAEAGIRILDFGELGYGPRALDVANTIFIERFSAALDGRLADADRFAEVFVASYADESGSSMGSDDIELGLDVRRRALGRWLDDLTHAPIGIARSTPEWRRRLRRYADTDPADWGRLD
jgi:Ser/Thr protein kinase RdoA (MazF antagonist)